MPGGTKRIPRAIREQQMLDAAIKVFASNGYHETSMESIAVTAKISKPMLYLYYGSKEELFASCLLRESAKFVEAVISGQNGAPLRDSTDPEEVRERLYGVIGAFLEFVESHGDSWQVLVHRASTQTRFNAHLDDLRNRIVSIMSAFLSSAMAVEDRVESHVEAIALAMVGASESVGNQVAAGNLSTPDATDVLTRLFWEGIEGSVLAANNNRDRGVVTYDDNDMFKPSRQGKTELTGSTADVTMEPDGYALSMAEAHKSSIARASRIDN